jgi:hypothetical protein
MQPENIYLPALSTLAPALKIHYNPETSTIEPCTDVATYVLLMSFPSGLGYEFTERLTRYDPVTLLLVGFWFALLAKLQHCRWWSLRRALAEGNAICLYLNSINLSHEGLSKAISILTRVFSD